MPIIRNREYLVSLTVYDNMDGSKGVTAGFTIRHPDSGFGMIIRLDADEAEIDYMIQCLIVVKAHVLARKKYLSERNVSHEVDRA